MVAYKTITAGTLLEQQPNIRVKSWVLAGAQPLDQVFKEAGAGKVGERDGADEPEAPPPAFAAVIKRDEHKQKQVKRCPEN